MMVFLMMIFPMALHEGILPLDAHSWRWRLASFGEADECAGPYVAGIFTNELG
jgi:hypothetical protein